MATIQMRQLLEAGVHFGHQAKRWNPKMKQYIFGERNGIYIIDLQKTLQKFRDAGLSLASNEVRSVVGKRQPEALPLNWTVRLVPRIHRRVDLVRHSCSGHRISEYHGTLRPPNRAPLRLPSAQELALYFIRKYL